MSGFKSSTATLRFFGDRLDPQAITERLGCSPTRCAQIGDVTIGRKAGQEWVAKTGSWLLSAFEQRPVNLEMQIADLLAKVSGELEVWKQLTSQYQCDLFCGLFMSTGNDGLSLSSATLFAVRERGLEIVIDLYEPVEE